jgi:filamentous hemagglutinin family protein
MKRRVISARDLRRNLLAAAVAACFASGGALGNPTLPTVVNGVVSMTSSPGVLQVTNSPNSIINWQTFSISAGELTRFNQQSAASAVLNRVPAGPASDIFGTLSSNGRVFLINPNGIVFGPGSTVDVAGLVASSLNLTDTNFLAGKLLFEPAVSGTGSVTNQGYISTPAGGHVLLVGPAVTNSGLINTPQGDVVLAAGNKVELENFGTPGLSVQITAPGNEAINLGSIMADSGRVGIFGGLIDQRGSVNANQAVMGVDGSIRLVSTGSTNFANGSQTISTGSLSVETADLTVSGNVQSGPQTVNATGAVVVRNELGGFAQLQATGGQTINARSMEVTGQGGGGAFVTNVGSGDQTIAVAGAGSSPGMDVRTLPSGGIANIVNSAPAATQTITVRDADHINVQGSGAGGAAQVINLGGTQTLSITGSGANAINFGGAGAQGGSYLIGTRQLVTAGQGAEAGSITIIGSDSNGAFSGISSQPSGSPGVQTISTSGTLSLIGGNATAQTPGAPAGIFDNTFGPQTISANRVVLQGGSVGSGNGAIIIAVNDSQQVNAGAGGITLIGGAGGTNNGAGIFQNRVGPALTQSIAVNDGGSLTLRGGSGGTGNGTFINSAGSQHVIAGSGGITLIGGAGGSNNSAGMFQTGADPALTQSIAVSDGGSITLRGGGGGSGNSVVVRANGGMQRIDVGALEVFGGSGGTMNFAVIVAPQQEVAVHGDLSLTGGASLSTPTAGGGALLGGGGAAPTNLMLTVGGNVTLNGGSAAGSGSSLGGNNAGGQRTDITMNVGGNVTLNPGAVSGTRIGSPATNLAGGEIVVNAGGTIALNSAGPSNAGAIRTTDGVTLRAREITQGPDAAIQANTLGIETQQGASLVGTNAVNAFNATNFDGPLSFNNASPLLTVSSVSQFMNGPLAISQMGDLLVTGIVQSGPQAIAATGALTVRGDATSSGQLSALGGQSISAHSMEVVGQDGGSAFVSNNGSGNQAITVTGAGAGLDVRTLSGSGTAGISNLAFGAPQSINVVDADHISVNSMGTGSAIITANGGTQAISIMGNGANAFNFGSSGALGASQIVGANQSITAGAPGQNGSITIVGSDGNLRLAGIVSQQGPGITQSVSTSGTLSILGGNASAQPSNTPAGIFHNGTGQQTISAQDIVLQGGSGGAGNSAQIGANNGTQWVDAGSIEVRGGAGGLNNGVQIRAAQGLQTIHAGEMKLFAGSGGTTNFAVITAPTQSISVQGDLAIFGGASLSTPTVGGGARVGGGGATPTSLTLAVGGDVTLTGGTVAGSGATIGSSTVGGQRTDITLNVGGNVTLNPGAVADTGTRIGSPAANVAGGEIVVNAGGAIALNSAEPGNAGAIRTSDGVTLRAREISQGADSRIQANTLTVETGQGASLTGNNSVNLFNAANTVFGDVGFNNTSPLLTVTGVQNRVGAFALRQTGDLLVNGYVSSGPQTIDVTGGLVVRGDALTSGELGAAGGQNIRARSLEVTSLDGGWASIRNDSSGDQTITIVGGGNSPGLDVRTLSGDGTAIILNAVPGATQAIQVTDADHISVDGKSGFTTAILANEGTQVISITGSGANAINLGSAGALDRAALGAVSQLITAGRSGEQGSITIIGSDGNARFAGIYTQPFAVIGDQTVNTSGTLSVTGGNAPAQVNAAGVFQNHLGQQTISANRIVLEGGASGSGNGVFINSNGSQQVNAGAGGITLVGGAGGTNNAVGIFQTRVDSALTQSIAVSDAGSLTLRGGGSGTGNTAVVGASGRIQKIDVGAGGITLIGGSSTGLNNFALINQASSNPAFTQTVRSAGDLLLDSGDAGERNFTLIQAFGGLQSIDAGQTTLRSGAGGVANFAAIQAQYQQIGVHGDLSLIAGGSVASATTGAGAGIGGRGGAAPTATNLSLAVDGNLTLTGGSVAGTGASIGASPLSDDPTVMSIAVGGNVVLNPGTVAGALARIGTRAASPAGGNIDISALGSVALNSTSPDMYSLIRTADGVTLRAREITQGVDSKIQANALTVETTQGASLGGNNSVSVFNATNTWFGDVGLNNTSPLLTVTGVQNFGGALALHQTGDALVNGVVFTGPQAINVTGGLIVQNEPGRATQLSANGGQTIDAKFVEVNAIGGIVAVGNLGGDQIISTSGTNAAGEGLAVRATGDGVAQITQSLGGAQQIAVRSADRVVIDGAQGFAGITNFDGAQVLSLTGVASGNALVMGSLGASGWSFVGGGTQVVIAGNAGESGSITLQGSDGGNNTGIFSSPVLGGTQSGAQSVSTSGALTVLGGVNPGAFASGIFANADGPQTIRAGSIVLMGGSAGTGNGAMIRANSGTQSIDVGAGGVALFGGSGGTNNSALIWAQSGMQQIDVGAGGITLRGGNSGTNNNAIINANNGSQQIDVGSGGITLIGGSGVSGDSAVIAQGSANPAFMQTIAVHNGGGISLQGGSAGSSNFANLRAAGGMQQISAGNTTLTGGSGGVDNFASIGAPAQDVTIHGDLVLTARGSLGSQFAGGGARIGGFGGVAPGPTNVSLSVDGNLTLTGGSIAGTGVSIGSQGQGGQPTSINMNVGGNVTLNPGTAPNTASRLGSPSVNVAGGNIELTAGGDIALNSTSPDQNSAIRTTGDVTLRGRSISQGADSVIQANSLATETVKGTSLVGANAVNSLSAVNSSSGSIAFNNASPLLTVTGIQQIPNGALSLDQAGNLLISGDVSSGAQAIRTTGDFTVTPQAASGVEVHANGAQTFSADGKFSLLGGSAWDGYALVTSTGPMRLQTGGDLKIAGGSGLLATAMLYGKDDVRLKVGNALRLDRGTGLLAFARVQGDFGDKIYVEFPNRSSGGYFVDGREGVITRGLDGFFTGLLPAVRGRSLILTYGQ